jgi:hypothetical protein
LFTIVPPLRATYLYLQAKDGDYAIGRVDPSYQGHVAALTAVLSTLSSFVAEAIAQGFESVHYT